MSEPSEFEWHILWRETNSRLDALSRSVAECKNLDGALDFARWLQFSGLVKFFKYHAHDFQHPQSGHFQVDGALIETKIAQLIRDIQDRYRTGDVQPHISAADLERINYKLDLIAGQLSYLPLPKVDISAPPLRVIEGGNQ
jgi:hypothetical protein